MQIVGMKGERHTGDEIWVCKTHHPLKHFLTTQFSANKTFLVVRNPMDVFPSYLATISTLSHAKKPDFQIHRDYPEWWAWWVRSLTQKMKRFFSIVRTEFFEKGCSPLYIVRYEDLVLQPKDTLMGLFGFILG